MFPNCVVAFVYGALNGSIGSLYFGQKGYLSLSTKTAGEQYRKENLKWPRNKVVT
jgi:hypothetical protein